MHRSNLRSLSLPSISPGTALASRSPETRVMSDASMATSVPVPMADPTSAWARAGASSSWVAYGGDVTGLVPNLVRQRLADRVASVFVPGVSITCRSSARPTG